MSNNIVEYVDGRGVAVENTSTGAKVFVMEVFAGDGADAKVIGYVVVTSDAKGKEYPMNSTYEDAVRLAHILVS